MKITHFKVFLPNPGNEDEPFIITLATKAAILALAEGLAPAVVAAACAF